MTVPCSVTRGSAYSIAQILAWKALSMFIFSWFTNLETGIGKIFAVLAAATWYATKANIFFSAQDPCAGYTLSAMFGFASAYCILYLGSPMRLPKIPGNFQRCVGTPPEAPVQIRRGEVDANVGRYFRDRQGRAVFLRGVNLGGGCKLPTDPAPGSDAFLFDERGRPNLNCSFVGRPLPLEAVDEHLSRLRSWGFTFLRLLVTWEAVEGRGPGVYDEEFLAYFRKIVIACRRFGISVFIDPHQDVWSRWTGGSGAPAWTLEVVGFDVDALEESASALTSERSTMFSIFFAGDLFAPRLKIGKESAQSFLQRHFIAAMRRVAREVADLDNVCGFDSLNEPSPGWAGRKARLDVNNQPAPMSWVITPFDAMRLGAGHALSVPFFSSPLHFERMEIMNPKKVCCWRDGPTSCVWRREGVYGYDKSGELVLLRPHHFRKHPKSGEDLNFVRDCVVPFFRRMAKGIRMEIPNAIIFAEPTINFEDMHGDPPPKWIREADVGVGGYCWAKHYYDGATLMTKNFRPWIGVDQIRERPVFGHKNVVAAHARALRHYASESEVIGSEGCPTLIGETGIPFDLGRKPPLNASRCTCALNTTMSALESALVSFTLWTYVIDNSNAEGDQWCGEDLSLWSKDHVRDAHDLHSGGRSLAAAVRPYPHRIAGDPIELKYDVYDPERPFVFSYRRNRSFEGGRYVASGGNASKILQCACCSSSRTSIETMAAATSVIFVPQYVYLSPHLLRVEVSPGSHWALDWNRQALYVKRSDRDAGADALHFLRLKLAI
eukprot:g3198.t1